VRLREIDGWLKAMWRVGPIRLEELECVLG